MLAFLPPSIYCPPRRDPPSQRWSPAAGCALALAASLPLVRSTPPDTLTGPLRIVGARATAAPVAHWVAIFQREHPRVKIATMLPGGGVAAGAMASGLADIAPMARRLKPQERALFADTGKLPAGIRVGRLSRADPATSVYLYVVPTPDARANRAAIEFVRIALSPEGRAR